LKRIVRGFRRLLVKAARFVAGDEERLAAFVARLPERVVERLKAEWWWQAHGGQQAPDTDWTVWLLMAGRGFGKTRAGAEWVMQRAREHPGARIALVGDTRSEAARPPTSTRPRRCAGSPTAM
jgi:hypothetical protein